jgi:hypothetical protein
MKELLITVLRVLFIVCICYIILDPLLTKLSMSFMDKADVYDSMVKLIPKHFTLVNFADAYQYAKYGQVLTDTLILCALSALSQTAACTLVGYGFSRKNGRRSAGSEYFARRAHSADPAGDEAICAQVGCAVKLIIAGLHEDALRAMDDQSRWEALEQAGLDPEEYDYLEN